MERICGELEENFLKKSVRYIILYVKYIVN